MRWCMGGHVGRAAWKRRVRALVAWTRHNAMDGRLWVVRSAAIYRLRSRALYAVSRPPDENAPSCGAERTGSSCAGRLEVIGPRPRSCRGGWRTADRRRRALPLEHEGFDCVGFSSGVR